MPSASKGSPVARVVATPQSTSAADDPSPEQACLSGVPLYLAYGFRPLEKLEIALEDGVVLECVSMEKPIE